MLQLRFPTQERVAHDAGIQATRDLREVPRISPRKNRVISAGTEEWGYLWLIYPHLGILGISVANVWNGDISAKEWGYLWVALAN